MAIADFAPSSAVSGVYDAGVGVVMLAGRPIFAALFAVPLPAPPIHADLNGVFLLAVAAGYSIPYREPQSAGGRAYLWIMGPLLKGLGALAFVLDYVFRHSPPSFLLFALSDGALALITLVGARDTSRAADALIGYSPILTHCIDPYFANSSTLRVDEVRCSAASPGASDRCRCSRAAT